MQTHRVPWDFYPQLSHDRLTVIAEELYRCLTALTNSSLLLMMIIIRVAPVLLAGKDKC